jgi:hypothetical protein
MQGGCIPVIETVSPLKTGGVMTSNGRMNTEILTI